MLWVLEHAVVPSVLTSVAWAVTWQCHTPGGQDWAPVLGGYITYAGIVVPVQRYTALGNCLIWKLIWLWYCDFLVVLSKSW